MKEIYVLRHAPKDASGKLLEGRMNLAVELGKRLGDFDIIFSSPIPRAVDTAVLLTGKEPIVDERAGGIGLTPDETKQTHEQGKLHPFGIAGVLFDSEKYRLQLLKKGGELAQLVDETFTKLSRDSRALIISHDGVMVAAYILLRNMPTDKAQITFEPLQGFKVYEDRRVEPFT
jgi:broad specificity phosphatase PhoE